MKKLLIVMIAAILLPSCMTTRTNVAGFKEQSKNSSADVYTYSKGKQCYLFWGLVPLGRTSVSTPANAACQVRTYYNFWDALVSTITGGIFGMQTIKIKAIRSNMAENEVPDVILEESAEEFVLAGAAM